MLIGAPADLIAANGSAATLLEVVNFYDQRFQMHLSEQQKRQLVAFLDTL